MLSAAIQSRSTLFKSFWLAGYEGASHINGTGKRIDMNAVTQHDQQVENDYALLKQFDIHAVRESIRWYLIEKNGKFDFSSVLPYIEAANRHNLQVNWVLCHYGWPNDVDVFADSFIDRFAEFAYRAVEFIKQNSTTQVFFTPINEISFLSWAICHSGLIYPYASYGKGRDYELKRHLVRAAISACDAIWKIDAQARIIHVDPLIHIIAPPNRPDLTDAAAALRAAQFEAFDMICGKIHPELGGAAKYLDIIGSNYYHDNQWEYLTNDRLHWHLKDRRRLPLHTLLAEIYQRYHRPLFIAETSHIGVGRGEWIKEIAEEIYQACAEGTPVQGICLYPALDRPDWENPNHWHNSGLWDLQLALDKKTLLRVVNKNYAADLAVAQNFLHERQCSNF